MNATLGYTLQSMDEDGNTLVVAQPRQGSEAIWATFNFCDKKTWFSESTYVDDEAASDSGDGLTWNLANSPVVDMVSGLVLDDDGVSAEQMAANPGSPHGYLVTVRVDSVEKTPRGYFATSGGDYEIDYDAGTITFYASQAGKDVRVDYCYAANSGYILAPMAGKVLDVEAVEAQFSSDVNMVDTIVFEIQGYVESYAPQYWDQAAAVGTLPFPSGDTLPTLPSATYPEGAMFYKTPTSPELFTNVSDTWQGVTPGPYPGGTRIPLVSQKYKRMQQLIDEAMGSYPIIPAIGGATRGTQQSTYGFPFRYGTVRRVTSSTGMQLHVRLENHQVFGGERGTATFYCTAKTED